jgi:hypothetical protein
VAGPDVSRVVQIVAQHFADDPTPKVGSGYRVSASMVLTATHALDSATPELVAVRSHLAGWTAGVLTRYDLGDDVSLLEIGRPRVDAGRALLVTPIDPPLYGKVGSRPGGRQAIAVGHPRAERKTTEADQTVPRRAFWDFAAAEGAICAVAGLRQGTFQFDIEDVDRRCGSYRAHRAAPAGYVGGETPVWQSDWDGMSGAALWVNDMLVGVITAEPLEAASTRLIATRLDHVLDRLDRDDPDRAAVARKALALDPRRGFLDAEYDPAYLLDDDEFDDLQWCLVAAAVNTPLRPIFREATGYMLEPPPQDDIMTYVGVLRTWANNATLFKFLTRLSTFLDSDIRGELNDWIDRTAPRYKVDLHEIRRLRDDLSTAVLLVQMEPDLLGDGWQIRAWTYVGQTPTPAAAPVEAWGRDELADWLSAKMGSLVDDLDPRRGTTQLTVEFLVDDETLLDEDLESLPVTLGGERYAIGTTCPVVMRSLERSRGQNWRDSWERKWRKLKECGDSYDPAVIHWIQPPDIPTAEPVHVAAAVAYAWSRADWHQVVTIVRESGTPVALWHRTSKKAAGRRPALEAVLRSVGLSHMPERVLYQRIFAARSADEDHIGRNLVLLWDDPDRVPSVHQWRAPAVEGLGS